MPQFVVPKFIEHEITIIGPFTFKQFIYIGVAGAIAFVLYFTAPFFIFLVASLILGGIALALAFMKIGGRSLPEMVKNFLMFSSAPKIYLWKKGPSPKLIKKKISKEKKEIKEEAIAPKIAGKSQLRKLSTKIETEAK
ncbi:hypothetical protein CL634_05600 [bacterium]|nr:hypothetical protein [bacterium]|tara:strand:- start:369 stop:782 length:414 start_codon:yes stop_codon:yes gene_type:complete